MTMAAKGKMKIINIPIEQIEMRYSANWLKWFKEELQERKYDHWNIHDSMWMMRKDIKDGAFLDVVGTQFYKSKQIEFICQLVDKGFILRNERVVFLIHDGWFPVEQLAYIRDGLGCHEWKFVGIFHDGTYDKYDWTAKNNMYVWGEDLENSWFKIYDKVIVGSNYHKQVLLESRNIPAHKIEVIPWRVRIENIDDYTQSSKENLVVWPHRLHEDKQPDLWNKVIVPDGWQKINSRDVPRTKHEYYQLLAKSKIVVSTALLEMFGIAMVEAVLLGCIPLVPDRLSYKEMYPKTFRYCGEPEFKEKLHAFCHKDLDVGMELKMLQAKFERNSTDFFDTLFELLEEL